VDDEDQTLDFGKVFTRGVFKMTPKSIRAENNSTDPANDVAVNKPCRSTVEESEKEDADNVSQSKWLPAWKYWVYPTR